MNYWFVFINGNKIKAHAVKPYTAVKRCLEAYLKAKPKTMGLNTSRDGTGLRLMNYKVFIIRVDGVEYSNAKAPEA